MAHITKLTRNKHVHYFPDCTIIYNYKHINLTGGINFMKAAL